MKSKKVYICNNCGKTYKRPPAFCSGCSTYLEPSNMSVIEPAEQGEKKESVCEK